MGTIRNKLRILVTLNNRWATFKCPPETQQRLKKYFRFNPPGYQFAPSFRDGSWDGYRNLFQRSRVAAGLFLRRRTKLEEKFELTIKDARVFPEFREVAGSGDRDYQTAAVDAMVAASNVGGLVLAATRTGKTRMAARYFQRLVGAGLFIVDELTLLDQNRAEIAKELGEPVGIVGRSKFQPERITTATIQTLALHQDDKIFLKWFRSLETVMIDEIHVAVNKRNIDVIRRIRPKAVFGLTATLELEKPEVRLPVIELSGPVVYRYSIARGEREDVLTPGTVCLVEFRDPLRGPTPAYRRGREWVSGDEPAAEYRYHVSLSKPRNDCIERIVREALRRGRRVIVMAERIAHLRNLSRRFDDVDHRVLSGNKELSGKSGSRLQALADMDAGKIGLLLASRVFGKGVTVRTVDTIVDGTAMPGRNAAIQRYGRGLGKSEGKDRLLYVDIADRGKFSQASYARENALRETRCQVRSVVWEGTNAEEVFEEKEKETERKWE